MKIYKYTVGTMGTNCYLAVDTESLESAVIDPGGEFEKLKDAIYSKDLKIRKIILTHAHFDHILALEDMRKLTGAPVLIHRDDAGFLTDPVKNLMDRFSDNTVTPRPADVLLSDGDTIAFGNCTLKVMHTPGHTPGSICLISEDTIICGDLLFRECIGRYDFPGGDYNTLIKSLEKLKRLDFNYKILPGHGPSTNLMHEKENNFYLQ